MAEERPKRQRTVRSTSEFCRGGLLHKEELELRRALQASLKEVKPTYNRKTRMREPRKRPETLDKPNSEKASLFNSQKKTTENVETQTKACRSFRGKRDLAKLPEKICGGEKMEIEKTLSPEGGKKRKKDERGAETSGKTCDDTVKKKKNVKTCVVQVEVGNKEVISSSSEDSFSEGSCEQIDKLNQVASKLLEKRKRILRHKAKQTQAAFEAIEEMHIPANMVKTEDFLTFLCLRGNSSLPQNFEVFNNPSSFLTTSARFANEDAFLCPTFPNQSSVTYSPPLSNVQSDSSAASPMSSTDSWSLSDE